MSLTLPGMKPFPSTQTKTNGVHLNTADELKLACFARSKDTLGLWSSHRPLHTHPHPNHGIRKPQASLQRRSKRESRYTQHKRYSRIARGGREAGAG